MMSTDARSTSRDRLRAMPCQKEENERSEVKSTKTIRMSLSREQPPARVERAQQEQDFTAQKHAPFRLWRLGKQHAVCPRLRTPLPASRSGHAGCRLFFFRYKRECGGLKPASRGEGGILREHGRTPLVRMFACSQSRIYSSQNAKCRFSPHLALTITFHYTHYMGECPL